MGYKSNARMKYVIENYEPWKSFSYGEKFRKYYVFILLLNRPHRNNPEASSITAVELKEILGDEYKKEVRTIVITSSLDFLKGNYTREYTIRPELLKLYNDFNPDENEFDGFVEMQSGKIIKSIPKHTVLSDDKSGKPKQSKVQFEYNLFKINYPKTLRHIEFLKQVLSAGSSKMYNDVVKPKKGDKSLIQIKKILKQVVGIAEHCRDVFKMTGEYGIISLYEEGDSGRLYDVGESIQRLNSDTRKIILTDMLLIDADIENTNIVMLYHLFDYYKAYAIKRNELMNENIRIPKNQFKFIKNYIENKRAVRERVAIATRTLEVDAKTALVATTTGVTLSRLPMIFYDPLTQNTDVAEAFYNSSYTKTKSSLFEQLGYDIKKYERLRRSSLVKSMMKETHIMIDFIVDVASRPKMKTSVLGYKDKIGMMSNHNGKDYIYNLKGKPQCTIYNPKEEKDNKRKKANKNFKRNKSKNTSTKSEMTNKIFDESEGHGYERRRPSQIMTHLYQGVEVCILENILEVAGITSDVQLVYDGLISKKWITNEMTDMVCKNMLEKYGINVKLSIENEYLKFEESDYNINLKEYPREEAIEEIDFNLLAISKEQNYLNQKKQDSLIRQLEIKENEKQDRQREKSKMMKLELEEKLAKLYKKVKLANENDEHYDVD